MYPGFSPYIHTLQHGTMHLQHYLLQAEPRSRCSCAHCICTTTPTSDITPSSAEVRQKPLTSQCSGARCRYAVRSLHQYASLGIPCHGMRGGPTSDLTETTSSYSLAGSLSVTYPCSVQRSSLAHHAILQIVPMHGARNALPVQGHTYLHTCSISASSELRRSAHLWRGDPHRAHDWYSPDGLNPDTHIQSLPVVWDGWLRRCRTRGMAWAGLVQHG